MEKRVAGNPARGKGGAVDAVLEALCLLICMLYLRMESSFLMILFLQWNGQNAKRCLVRQKRGAAGCLRALSGSA